MLLGIDHIGLVTAEPAALAPFLATLGMSRTDGGIAAGYLVTCEFWRPGGPAGQPSIELVSPSGPGSVLEGHLDRRGPGLHHIAFRVDGIEPELQRLREAGFAAVDQAPREGARPGMRVAFTYLPQPGGMLVELVQYDPATPPPAG